MRTYKQRKSNISEAQQRSLMYLIKSKNLTMETKTNLVNERNPYLYAFGERLTPQHYEETYTDWVKRSYAEEPEHITSKEEAMQYLADLIQKEEQ